MAAFRGGAESGVATARASWDAWGRFVVGTELKLAVNSDAMGHMPAFRGARRTGRALWLQTLVHAVPCRATGGDPRTPPQVPTTCGALARRSHNPAARPLPRRRSCAENAQVEQCSAHHALSVIYCTNLRNYLQVSKYWPPRHVCYAAASASCQRKRTW